MSTLPPWTDDPQDIEDLIEQSIADSMDMDWTARTGARAVIRDLALEGFKIVKVEP